MALRFSAVAKLHLTGRSKWRGEGSNLKVLNQHTFFLEDGVEVLYEIWSYGKFSRFLSGIGYFRQYVIIIYVHAQSLILDLKHLVDRWNI